MPLIHQDEAVWYYRGAVNNDPRRLGLLKDFLQVLLQAVGKVANAALVAGLIASATEASDLTGTPCLRALEDVFARMEEVTEPVARDDVAEVLRRRLFSAVAGHPPCSNDRLSWQARRRLEQPFKEVVGWQAKAFGLQQPRERARVVVTFTHRGRRYMGDVDNLYSRAKPLVDALKGILVVDDSPAHLVLEVHQQLGQERSVCVQVWPA
jgi:hypothetical protein